ncbi:STAS domain-containing protein [bacterium]|nr:STAS domain-containing protein [bacterium]
MVKIKISEKEFFVYVKLEGKLDIDSELYFKKKMTALMEKGYHQLIFDMEEVTYINSFGLGVLTNVWRKVKAQQGALRLVCLSPKIKRLFQLTWLTKVFELFETLEEAENLFIEENQ